MSKAGTPTTEKKHKKEKSEKKEDPSKSGEGTIEKAKKNLASKAATSRFGKSLLTKVMDDQSNHLMKSVKSLVELQSDRKKAKELQNNIIRMLVKAQHQIEAKKVLDSDFFVVDRPLRKSFRRMVRITNSWAEIQKDPAQLDENFNTLKNELKEIEGIIMKVLGPHVTEKNRTKFSTTFEFLSNLEFLKKVWSDERSKPHLQTMASAMTHYLKNPSRAPKIPNSNAS